MSEEYLSRADSVHSDTVWSGASLIGHSRTLAQSSTSVPRGDSRPRRESVGQALGDVLPLAVAVAIFPVPIIAVVLVLGSDRGTAKGVALVLAWLVGLTAVGGIVLVLAGPRMRVTKESPRPG